MESGEHPVTVFRQLDRSLRDHLSTLESLAQRGDDQTAIALARNELPRIVAVVRALLDQHQPDENGRCPTCRRGRWSRRAPAPCRAYIGAQLCLMLGEQESRHGKHLRSVG
ncbi:hypothetical protein Lesp02_18220 [Lentzea sp. NBRC 105346]|uniref:hypothetical protein n=1 Tax=Lentzea sp. NBRC 105346 TaxID=3032205 RepID=UPI0024A53538|nr:hypothetical protein [Lentzea sp. NBRC 105346]GLZ29632.1 hypothetical protein Lesp02_18220 [Lentzea sp. NBRC 105346]